LAALEDDVPRLLRRGASGGDGALGRGARDGGGSGGDLEEGRGGVDLAVHLDDEVLVRRQLVRVAHVDPLPGPEVEAARPGDHGPGAVAQRARLVAAGAELPGRPPVV